MITENDIWQWLTEVNDPEIPVLSVIDIGIIRSVKVEGEQIFIIITPTYSGCPAMDVIRIDIRLKLAEKGCEKVHIQQSISPAWTTEWMTEEGKQKLKQYGIAPPNARQQFCNIKEFFEEEAVQCPQCNSYNTSIISRFGSTACKALYRCNNCKEAFDYFKCH